VDIGLSANFRALIEDRGQQLPWFQPMEDRRIVRIEHQMIDGKGETLLHVREPSRRLARNDVAACAGMARKQRREHAPFDLDARLSGDYELVLVAIALRLHQADALRDPVA